MLRDSFMSVFIYNSLRLEICCATISCGFVFIAREVSPKGNKQRSEGGGRLQEDKEEVCMKLLKKMIAFVIVIATVLSVVGIAPEQAEAAANPKINVSSKIIYVGGSSVRPSYGDTYTFYIKNRPKKYSVTWSSSDEKVAKIEKLQYSKAKVTAVSAGKATITADFIDKVTSTKYTLTTTVTVKKNAAAVSIAPATIPRLDKGETISLSATLYNKDASEAKSGEVTDTVKWISSDPSIATVNSSGLVTAVAAGKATITCYTVQKTSGTYSKLEKATAKKSIEIEVNDPAVIGIVSVSQTSLTDIKVTFGGDYSKNVSKDNLTVTKDGILAPVKEIKFSEDGLEATVTMYSALTDGSLYTLTYNNSLLTEGKSAGFKASVGDPVRMELYTDVNTNRVIAGKFTPIRFRLFNASNVDITPTDVNSQDYLSAAARLTLKQADTSSNAYSVWSIDYASKSVFVFEAGKTITLSGEYTFLSTDGTTYTDKTVTAVIQLTSVTEASTMVYDSATITASGKAGELLDWTTPVTRLSVSDQKGFKLVARVKNGEGKYIYSNDDNSQIKFGSSTSTSCFVKDDGSIVPFATGTDTVVVYYGPDITTGVAIGSIIINVVGQRVPSRLIIEQNGSPISTLQTSDAYGVSEDSVNIRILDQYGDQIDITNNAVSSTIPLSTVIVTSVQEYGPSANVYANTDGTGRIEINSLGIGATSGKSYSMKVSYSDPSYGTLDGYFTVLVFTPNPNATSSYRVMVEGDKNMKVGSGLALPKLEIKLFEMKGNVRYSRILTVKPSPNSGFYVGDGDFFYRIYKADATSTEIKKGLSTDYIEVVYEENNGLVKYETGAYVLRVFKRNGTQDGMVASTEFTLTDTAGTVKWDLVSPTTKIPLKDNMTKDEIKMVFAECFKLTIGTDSVGTSQIDFSDEPITNNGQIFFRTVLVTETVSVNSRIYTLTHKVTLNTTIRNK